MMELGQCLRRTGFRSVRDIRLLCALLFEENRCYDDDQ
jgi:hypothetical protein